MSKFKLSHLFWAVLAVGALFVAACDTGTDDDSSGPGLLKLAESPSGIYVKSGVGAKGTKSGDGNTMENAVEYRVSVADAQKAAENGGLYLGDLFADEGGTYNYEVVSVYPVEIQENSLTKALEENADWVGISLGKSHVTGGYLKAPEREGDVTVKVTGGASGAYRYVRIVFHKTKVDPKTGGTNTKISSNATISAPVNNVRTVTIPPDGQISLDHILASALPEGWDVSEKT